MGMMELNQEGAERKKNSIQNFNDMKKKMTDDLKTISYTGIGGKKKVEINKIPYFFGSHYSNPMYVCHYLVRIFPYTFIAIEIQGKSFDTPNRLFKSIASTFKSVTLQKMDVRELIPEFFYLSEMFYNINNLNLKLSNEDDVKLPPYANNTGYNFVIKLRQTLEDVNSKINKWIDLIFGIKQNSKKGEEAKNLFFNQSYYGEINEDFLNEEGVNIEELLIKAEIGHTPHQILYKEMKKKNTLMKPKNFHLYHKVDKQQNNNLPIALIEDENISILYDNFQIAKLKIKETSISSLSNIQDKEIKLEEVIKLIKKFVIPSILKSYHYENSTIFIKKYKTLVMGGLYEGIIILIHLGSSINYVVQLFVIKNQLFILQRIIKNNLLLREIKKALCLYIKYQNINLHILKGKMTMIRK